jgi:hypothetical protein
MSLSLCRTQIQLPSNVTNFNVLKSDLCHPCYKQDIFLTQEHSWIMFGFCKWSAISLQPKLLLAFVHLKLLITLERNKDRKSLFISTKKIERNSRNIVNA